MRRVIHRTLPVILITIIAMVGHTPVAASLARGNRPASVYMTLEATPASVSVGSVVTLDLIYHDLGAPSTTIVIEPKDALRLDPPLSMPCNYNLNATDCREIIFRAQRLGTVTISASTNGEIYDSYCSCWRWGGYDADSTVVTITGSRILLPIVRR